MLKNIHRHTRFSLLIFTTFLILLVGCKKEKDTHIPVITYYSPQHNQAFNVLDTVLVEALITDQKMITSVKVNLTNEEFITVSEARSFSPNTNSYELKTKLAIDDEALESGTYYVLIRADNGDNFKNKYQQILIQGTEQEFVQLLAVTDGGFMTLKVMGSADLETTTTLFSLTGDFSASAISSADKLLFIAGRNNPNLHAYNLESNSLSWYKEITPGKPIHNDGCLHFDGLLYTSYNYEFIQGYTPTGQTGFFANMEEEDAPERIFRHGDYILVEIQKKNTAEPYIATYYNSTGIEKQRQYIDFDVIDFYSEDDDNLTLVANKNVTGVIYRYNVSINSLTSSWEAAEIVTASAKAGQETLVLAGPNTLFAYIPGQDAIFPILEEGAQHLAYEHLSKSLILGQIKKISIYQFPEMVNQKTLLLSDTILDLQIQYSK